MPTPFNVFFEPNSLADRGLAAYSLFGDEYIISGLSVITFGFLMGEFWAYCDDDATTVWATIADETTTWSDC